MAFSFSSIARIPRSSSPIYLRVDSDKIKSILAKKGYYPAFHMNKKCWVSIILEDALTDEEIEGRIHDSYESL